MADDKVVRILKAAERLFSRQRFHEVTLDAVARLARVGKGTIYLHFAGKDDLFFKSATAGFSVLCENLRGEMTTGADFGERLRASCRLVAAFMETRYPLYRMMQAEEARRGGANRKLLGQWLAQRAELVELLSDLMATGAAAGELRRDLPPRVLTYCLLGLLRTRAWDLVETACVQPDETVVELFLNGAGRKAGTLRPPPPTRNVNERP